MLLSACATSTGTSSSEVNKADKAIISHNTQVKPADKVICRRERATGTRMTKKICRTQRQIEAEHEAGQRTMDKIRTSTSQGAGDG
jgi:hypothetical protein